MPVRRPGTPRDLLGEEIRRVRLAMGETQEQFRHRFGIERTTLVNWEHRGAPKTAAIRFYIKHRLARLQTTAAMRTKRKARHSASWNL